MNTPEIRIRDKTFTLHLSASHIREKVEEMGDRISEDLKEEKPLFIAVLNGAFMFAADLFRALSIDAEITFVKLASYEGMRSSGKVSTAIGLDKDLHNRTVVILEDIIDTGTTLHQFLPEIKSQNPRKLILASLLSKPGALQYAVKPDYLGFAVPDKFLVGYGLDYEGWGRNLPDIYQMTE
jgi:hypoxanthine phosphoribosyltransferase